jgi:hypothetical protein
VEAAGALARLQNGKLDRAALAAQAGEIIWKQGV